MIISDELNDMFMRTSGGAPSRVLTDDMQSFMRTIHHRDTLSQVDIQRQRYIKKSVVNYLADMDSEKKAKELMNDGLQMLFSYDNAMNEMIEAKALSFTITPLVLDIIINYPFLVPLLRHNPFVINGLGALTACWRGNAIDVLERMNADIDRDFNNVRDALAILRYGTGEDDITRALDSVELRGCHAEIEYWANPHISPYINATEMMTRNNNDHKKSLSMIKRKSRHGYIDMNTCLDIGSIYDRNVVTLLGIYDEALGISYRIEEPAEDDYPQWVAQYVKKTYSRNLCIRVPTDIFWHVADVSDMPRDFILENVKTELFSTPWG